MDTCTPTERLPLVVTTIIPEVENSFEVGDDLANVAKWAASGVGVTPLPPRVNNLIPTDSSR